MFRKTVIYLKEKQLQTLKMLHDDSDCHVSSKFWDSSSNI